MIQRPRIFIAGCGYTGERCADFFSRQGDSVQALVSSKASAERLARKPYPVFAADASDPAALRAAPFEAEPDVLVHCLSGRTGRDPESYRKTYVRTLRCLTETLRPKFTVFTGSTSVYTQDDGSTVTEESPAGGSPTADVLLEAEQFCLTGGGAVVRLGGIYGPGRARFLESVLSGQGQLSRAHINLIHADDAAAAVCHVGARFLGGIFNAVDDSPAPRDEIAAGIHGNLAQSNGAPTGKKVSNAKLRATGWSPRYRSLAEAYRSGAV